MQSRLFHLTLLLSFSFVQLVLSAQSFPTQTDHDKKVDSFLHVLKTAKEDTSKVNTLIDFGKELLNWSADETPKAMENFKLAVSLSEKLNYQRGKASACYWIASSLSQESHNEEALKYYWNGLKIGQSLK